MIRRGYIDAGWGQIHYREAGQGAHPPLICLHATAYSGRSLTPLLPPLAQDRRVLALDTPGYGASDGPPTPVPFERYADAIGDAIDMAEPGRAMDIFGYHTGAMIALDLAARRPGLVRRLVLIGVPFFQGADKAIWRERLVRPTALNDRLDQFAERWDYLVAHRAPGFSIERGLDNFADELMVYPREWFAHQALFDFDADATLDLVRQPALIINPDSPLSAASREAARRLVSSSVTELPDIRGAIFDTAAEELARHIVAFCAAPG